jgi:hypothetical protein
LRMDSRKAAIISSRVRFLNATDTIIMRIKSVITRAKLRNYFDITCDCLSILIYIKEKAIISAYLKLIKHSSFSSLFLNAEAQSLREFYGNSWSTQSSGVASLRTQQMPWQCHSLQNRDLAPSENSTTKLGE